MIEVLRSSYERLVIGNAPWTLAILAVCVVFMAVNARDFELDASAESLVIEGDPAYRYYRQVSQRYGAENFLVLTYTPNTSLFSRESLNPLEQLRNEIRGMKRVESVVSVLDVPLLSNPPVPMTQLVSNIKSLEDPSADIELAKQELANSPLYVNLLLNLDYNTTALQINFPRDDVGVNLQDTRQAILDNAKSTKLTKTELKQLDGINGLIRENNRLQTKLFHEDIITIRKIMKNYDQYGELHLGGVPMLADDIMTFVRSDLMIFGVGVLIFLVATLLLIFKQFRWVFIPLICCATVVIFMMGMLGKFHWQVTVVSSNFISLLLILTLSMSIHLIVRYRELLRRNPQWDQPTLVTHSVRQIFVPCMYMALTTGVAFISLVVSGIRPVINFGLMMTTGILVAFAITFTLFPSLMLVIGKDKNSGEDKSGGPITTFFARLTLKHGYKVMAASVAMAALTVVGISQLVVENAFIDYFGQDTEIYQGMSVIDQRLGGTTPLEVLIDFPVYETARELQQAAEDETSTDTPTGNEDEFVDDGFLDDTFLDDGFGEGDEFVDEDFLSGMDDPGGFEEDFEGEDDPAKYWFTTDKIDEIKQVHAYLEGLPAVGKVISLATMVEIAESFNEGQPLTNVQLALLYSVIPEEFRAIVIDPYVSVEHSQARINLRILDSDESLQRDQLLKTIQADLTTELGIEPERVHLSGMMVLYNNMLQSLYQSQIATLGTVFAGIMIMFLILFRSWRLSLIAMAPNMLAAGFVLGVMGWVGIPLDIMTITIASITIGIAVDNTIHYIVRFKKEFELDNNYLATLHRSHGTIGKAMFYTSITIMIGFSILVMSNFKPTIYFGLLTAMAMFIALVGALTLLPQLLVMFKPLHKK